MKRKARLYVRLHIDVKKEVQDMREKTSLKRRVKVGILALMGIGFLMLSPQLTMGAEGIAFVVIWTMMAMLGAVSLYHEWKGARRSARAKAVYTFKKKLRTPKEARSRISVRLKA
jgi:uncharacterized membrane protein YbaN (DUF454 family)